MKLVFTFFLFLCFHLPGGYDYAHANAPGKKKPQVENVNARQDYTRIENGGLVEATAYLIDMEDEDEEDIIKKHLLTARHFLAVSDAFNSNHRSRCPADRLPFCQHLSCAGSRKYIVQRVLRI